MKRNTGIDLLKTFCAFLVVCIHATIPGRLGLVTTPLLKIAVPLFFMITGYYYKQTKDQQRERERESNSLKFCGC